MKFTPIGRTTAKDLAKWRSIRTLSVRSFTDPTDDEVIAAIRSVPTHYADLVPVPASMVVVAGQITYNGKCGEALTQGQAVFADTANNFSGGAGAWWRSSANTTNKDQASGIVLNTTTAAGQVVAVLADGVNGQINLGCAVAAGAVYIASSNLGGIVLYIDGTTPTTGWKTCIIGIGISTTVLKLDFFNDNSVAHL